MTIRRTKKFLYKKASFLQPIDGENLEMILKKACKKSPKPMQRQHNPTGDEQTFCFLNYTKDSIPANGGRIFGVEFLSYVKGADQSTLNIDPDADEVSVTSLALKQGEEFLEGNVYLGIVKDHVILMQSNALRSKELEDHLNWFLVELTQTLHPDNRITLDDALPIGVAADNNIYSDATGLKISAPFNEVIEAEKEGEGAQGEKVSMRHDGLGAKALSAILGFFDIPDYLKPEDLEKTKMLKVDLLLRWSGAKKDEDTQDFLTTIAKQMRHIDQELDYEITTKSGPIGKVEFKPAKPVSVKWTNGRPHFDEVFPSMLSWLSELLNAGKIQA